MKICLTAALEASDRLPLSGASSVDRSGRSTATLLTYEYGALHVDTGTVFRAGMSLEQAAAWLTKWDQRGRSEAFAIIRRQVGPWETP